MTPSARLSAAIEVLDRVLAGAALEQALVNWGRANRYAGSGDRHAVRDLVFDAWRCRRSFAGLGGGETGRGLVLGGQRAFGDVGLFDGVGHGPAAVTEADAGVQAEGLAALDCPDWLGAELQASLGATFVAVMQAMQRRAPVFVRVNVARATVEVVQKRLADEGITTQLRRDVKTALEATDNARKLSASQCHAEGLIDLQDLSSQAVVQALPLAPHLQVLDYCAGGGGKTLAMAAHLQNPVHAYDAEPRRMGDLPGRATRARARVTIVKVPKGPYDLVLADAPCSGSGSWRRDPVGKWALTPARLAQLMTIQAQVMDAAAALTAPHGVFAYATCSLLACENQAQAAAFLQRNKGWQQTAQHHWTPVSGGDGFFLALFARN
jgi:16S rRNA (cytosine967-C5)-methyltransferase